MLAPTFPLHTALSTLQIEDFNICPICLRATLACNIGIRKHKQHPVGQILPLCSCGHEPTYAGRIRRLNCWDASHWPAMCPRLNMAGAQDLNASMIIWLLLGLPSLAGSLSPAPCRHNPHWLTSDGSLIYIIPTMAIGKHRCMAFSGTTTNSACNPIGIVSQRLMNLSYFSHPVSSRRKLCITRDTVIRLRRRDDARKSYRNPSQRKSGISAAQQEVGPQGKLRLAIRPVEVSLKAPRIPISYPISFSRHTYANLSSVLLVERLSVLLGISAISVSHLLINDHFVVQCLRSRLLRLYMLL